DELTLAHEIGHNFSLEHANVQQCSYPDRDAKIVGASYGSTSCIENPYADLYDVMGMSFVVNDGRTLHGNDNTPALNAISKLRLGLISSTDAPVLTTAATSATYSLNGASALSGRRALKIIDPISNERYYVEYRNAQGRDAGSLYSRFANPPAHWQISDMGPGIRILKAGPGGKTSVVLPDSDTADNRRLAWVRGRTFTSRTGGLKVGVVSTSATTASVKVTIYGKFTGDKLPTISGEPFVTRTLTAKPSTTWSPTPTSYTYQWYRNGAAISGAKAKTYVVTATDKGKNLTVRVVAVKTAITSRGWTSAATATIASLKSFTGTALPTIKGTRKVGSTLSALSGSNWAPKTTGTTYKYAWYRGTVAISGATGKTYTQVTADVGKVIRVKVTAVRYGYASKSGYSSTTAAKTVR
ncbi:MAG: hypothetical protein ABWX76_02510, partial [Leifsonia flava]